jgi:uncharacterized membrane protein YdjX (TVP38/TMEM64 family)
MLKEEQQTAVWPTLPQFLRTHRQKIAPLAFWLIALGGYFIYTRTNNISTPDAIRQLVAFMTGSVYAPLIYIAIYGLRPLLFFPSTLLTLAGGFLFGPIGILYTIIAGNLSAMVAYFVGAYFGSGILENDDNSSFLQKYANQLRQNSFETVLIMRLIFLPYDLVNYAAGFLHVKWLPFLLATALGSIPGTISVVLLGASFGTLDDLVNGNVTFNPYALAFSVFLIVVSIIVSRIIKKRTAQGTV